MNNTSKNDWSALYREYKSSDMSIAGFARSKNISLTTCYTMIGKYRKKEAAHIKSAKEHQNQPEFIPAFQEDSMIRAYNSAEPSDSSFITVETQKISLRIPFYKDIDYVREVIKAVKGLC